MVSHLPGTWLAVVALSALIAIALDWHERRPPAFYLFKPLTTALIIAVAWQAPDSVYRSWLLWGLALALLGDVCLMFDSNPAFIAGLSSFLLAHALFIPAFLSGIDTPSLPWWSLAYPLAGGAVFVRLIPRAGPLSLPVMVYGAVLLSLALAATAHFDAQPESGRSVFILAGATLFLLSDSALGWRRFMGAYRGAQGLILSTYWAAISCFALAAYP